MKYQLIADRYFILHPLSNSSFCQVLLAVNLDFHPPQRCVIKIFKINQKPLIQQWLQQKFRQKAAILQKLSLEHHQIPEIYAYFCTSEACYIVQELIMGITLKQKVSQIGVLSPAEVRGILIELLLVLDTLHSNNLIYHNITPENIILREADNLPILISFSNIKYLIEQALLSSHSQAFPLIGNKNYEDLYGLGLTAIYLLSGKTLSNLKIDSSTGKFCLSEIETLDSSLAAIIDRAVNSNPSCPYTAKEMLMALRSPLVLIKNPLDFSKTTFPIEKSLIARFKNKTINKHLFPLVALISGLVIALSIWQIERNRSLFYIISAIYKPIPSYPEPADEFLLPTTKIHSEFETTKKTIELPIFATGVSQTKLVEALGQPTKIKKGSWNNSKALIYQNVVSTGSNTIYFGYLVDKNSNKLRQIEVEFARTIGLRVMLQTLPELLGKSVPFIETKLAQIYQRQINSYSFKLGNLKGTIGRNQKDNIYFRVWEANFH